MSNITVFDFGLFQFILALSKKLPRTCIILVFVIQEWFNQVPFHQLASSIDIIYEIASVVWYPLNCYLKAGGSCSRKVQSSSFHQFASDSSIDMDTVSTIMRNICASFNLKSNNSYDQLYLARKTYTYDRVLKDSLLDPFPKTWSKSFLSTLLCIFTHSLTLLASCN